MSYEEKLEIDDEELTLRTWDFEEDHEKVSELLELVFEEELESKGLEMKNVFDEYKSLLPFFKIMGLFNKDFKHTLDGFVIENSEGRIIASVNLSYSIYHWEISMVATHPDYRRKGLARKLVTLAVDHAKELGAKLCVLEVKDINRPAYNLYKSLEFVHYDSVSRYKLEHEKLSSIVPIILPKGYDFGELKRNKKTNQSRYELDIRSTPEETQIFQPISKKKYHKPLLIRLIRPLVKLFIKMKISQWTIHREDALIGTLYVYLARKEGSPHRVELMLDPDHRELLTKPLLTYGLIYVKNNFTFKQNTIVELRTSDEDQKTVCLDYDFTIIETVHLLGLKLIR